MTASVVGKRYAKALYALGEEANALGRIRTDLRDIALAWHESRQLRSVFENPAFGAEVRARILHDAAASMGLHDHTRNLLLLLSDRKRLRYVPDIAHAFETMSEALSGKVRADVTSAGSLPESYLSELARTLAEVVGREVVITHHTDPVLIGGVVTRIGDRVFDGSVRNRLSELREELLR